MTDAHTLLDWTIDMSEFASNNNPDRFLATDISHSTATIYEKHGFDNVRVLPQRVIHTASIDSTIIDIEYEMGDPRYSATVTTPDIKSTTVYTNEFLRDTMKKHDLMDYAAATFWLGGEYALKLLGKKEWGTS